MSVLLHRMIEIIHVSSPITGVICVSVLKGPREGAPKWGARVEIRAIGQSSLTNLLSTFPSGVLMITRPPIPRSLSHQVLLSAPPYGATPS